jgi:hypothetical protein
MLMLGRKYLQAIWRWTKRFAAGFVVVTWLIVGFAWLESYRTQDVIEWPMAGRLLRVHIQWRGVMFTIVSGWPLREGTLWQRRPVGGPWSGIPVQLTLTRSGIAGQLTNELLLPGIVRHRGAGMTDGVGSLHLDQTRSGRLPRVPATVSAVTVSWPWLVGVTTSALAVLIGRGVWKWHRRHSAAAREGRGLCAICGYDLRASVGVCPECGASRPAAASMPSAAPDPAGVVANKSLRNAVN